MKYALFIDGILWDYFRTIKEIDEFLFEKGLDNFDRFHIEVKKVKR